MTITREEPRASDGAIIERRGNSPLYETAKGYLAAVFTAAELARVSTRSISPPVFGNPVSGGGRPSWQVWDLARLTELGPVGVSERQIAHHVYELVFGLS